MSGRGEAMPRAFISPAAMTEKPKFMTADEAAAEEAWALRRYIELMGQIRSAGGGVVPAGFPPDRPGDNLSRDARYARLPLGEAILEYLTTCTSPQTTKQIAAAFKKAGREFEADNPARAVRDALKKLLPTNPDLFHSSSWGRWHLRSKYKGPRKAKLEELLSEVNGLPREGGAQEHGKRTKAGLEAA